METVARTLTFSDPLAFLRLNTMAIVGMSGTAADQGDHERERLVEVIARESEPVLARYTSADGLQFESKSNVAIARA